MKRIFTSLILTASLLTPSVTALAQDKEKPDVIGLLFYADWCASCKVLEPKLNAVKKDFADKSILFTRVNLTDEYTISQSKLLAGGERAFGGLDTDLYAKARAVLENSRTTAAQGAQRLARLFPDWRVTAEAMADSPGWGLVERARTWKADLIVVGAHSHTPFQRFFFGSAASAVVMQASCSVRISRPRKHSHHSALRIVLAVDGSPESEQAARETASRTWPSETEVRALTVLDSRLEVAAARSDGFAQPWLQEHYHGMNERISAMTVKLAESLRTAGRAAEPHIFRRRSEEGPAPRSGGLGG